MNTVEIDGKVFEYAGISLGKSQKIRSCFAKMTQGKSFPKEIRIMELSEKMRGKTATELELRELLSLMQRMMESNTSFSGKIKERFEWYRVCNLAFKKNFLWKWFRIIPKQLRFGIIDHKIAGGIQADFFGHWQGTQKEQETLLKDLSDSSLKNIT